METPRFAKRSACDRCRQKRLRCPRTHDSIEPCARCLRVGATCTTGTPGLLGRPRKTPVDGPQNPPRAVACSPSHRGVASPRLAADLGLHMSWVGDQTLAEGSAAWSVVNTPSNLLGDLEPARPAQPALHSEFALQHLSDTWSSHQTLEGPLGSASAEENCLLGPLSLGRHANFILREEALFGGDNFDMTDPGHGRSDIFGNDTRNPSIHVSCDNIAQSLNPTILLSRLGEKLTECSLAMDSIGKPEQLAQGCLDLMEKSMENPVAPVISCTKELTEIVRKLHPSQQPAPSSSNAITITSAAAFRRTTQNSLSTPTLLLILSNYLRLMQIYDSLFCNISQASRKIPIEMMESARVKAVFRIGDFPTMEDISVKTYAKGVADVIQNHIQDLQRCLGLPARYCLSDKTSFASNGIFSNIDIAPLLQVVMTQEDIRSPGGGQSHVDSIRGNINAVIELLGN